MAKGTNFKFGTHAPRERPDMSPVKFFEKGAWRDPSHVKIFEQGEWLRSRYPINFWALNANSSKTAKDTNFKFGTYAPRKSSDMTAEKLFEQGVWIWSRDPVNYWALNANSSKTAKDKNFKFGMRAAETVRSWPETPKKLVRVMWPLKFLGIKR